ECILIPMTRSGISCASQFYRFRSSLREDRDGSVGVPALAIGSPASPAPAPTVKEGQIIVESMVEVAVAEMGRSALTTATSHSGRACAHDCNSNQYNKSFGTHCTHSLKLNYARQSPCKRFVRLSHK